MKAQIEIAYPPPSAEDLANTARRLWQEKLLPAIRTAVDRQTLKEASFLMNVKGSMLSDALAGRTRKGMKVEWLLVLLMTLPEVSRHELLSELTRLCGYKPPERKKTLTSDDENNVIKRFLKTKAPGLLDALAKELEEAA